VAWFFLKGKAHCCGKKISVRYPIVEVLTAFLFLGIFMTQSSLPNFIIGCTLTSLLVVITFIDVDTMEIEDALSMGGAFVGLAIALFFPEWHGERSPMASVARSFWGMCFGSGIMFWIAACGEIVFKREAVGLGDVKLMGMVGGFLGWKGCLVTIFGGCFLSAFIVFPFLLAMKLRRREKFAIPREIPFAPFLSVGAISYVLLGCDLPPLLFWQFLGGPF
jgi:leader peptidase (prepilin peptidase)/N-methyltransferase